MSCNFIPKVLSADSFNTFQCPTVPSQHRLLAFSFRLRQQ